MYTYLSPKTNLHKINTILLYTLKLTIFVEMSNELKGYLTRASHPHRLFDRYHDMLLINQPAHKTPQIINQTNRILLFIFSPDNVLERVCAFL